MNLSILVKSYVFVYEVLLLGSKVILCFSEVNAGISLYSSVPIPFMIDKAKVYSLLSVVNIGNSLRSAMPVS